MRWRRGVRLPDEARRELALEPGERVLAVARRPDGGWVVGTDRALVATGVRTPWVDVAHAQWLDEEGVLVVETVHDPGRSARYPLDEPGRLPETVRERVTASIVVSRRVAVGDGGLRVVGRREATGELLWQVVPDPGVDLEQPVVREVADRTLRQMREELGE